MWAMWHSWSVWFGFGSFGRPKTAVTEQWPGQVPTVAFVGPAMAGFESSEGGSEPRRRPAAGRVNEVLDRPRAGVSFST